MDRSPEEVIRRELGPSERLRWWGQPPQGLILRAADAFLIPFSIAWGGFAIFWEAMVIAGGAPFFFALWGIPFVLVGLYLMVGRFWMDARQRASTVYAVTSERVVIASGLRSRRVQSLSIDSLSDITLTERTGGAGLIAFGPRPSPRGWYAGDGWPGAGWPGFGMPSAPSFDLPGEAREVYEMIREARRAAVQRT